MKMERLVYEKLGQFDGFYTHPPRYKRKHYLKSGRLIKFNNDGHEVWLGTAHEWFCFYTHQEWREMLFWYLWQWAFVDWFGLRSKIWFWLLHREVERFKPAPRGERDK